MTRRRIALLTIVAVSVGTYFLRPTRRDYKAISDTILARSLVDQEQVPALRFLDEGGIYADINAPASTNLDETVVRPLVERLENEGQLQVYAALDTVAHHAFAMLAELPDDEAQIQRIERIFRESDDAHSATILRQFGHRWLHFTVLDEETAKATNADKIHAL